MEKRVRAMYFSGTNTTAKVTAGIAYRLWQELDKTENKKNVSGETDGPINYVKAANINFTPKKAREKVYSFDADDIVIFGTPVIAGRVPNVLLDFLDTLQGGGAMAVPVVLYGNRDFDDALIELRNILEDRGFRAIAAAAFVGEHSFSTTLAAGRPDNEDMKIAYQFACDIADKVLWLMKESEGSNDRLASLLEEACPVEVDGQEPLRPYYKPRDRKGEHIDILKVIPKLETSKCTGCGMCVPVCPMGSIKETAPGVVDGICIKCCACVKKCPEKALYYDDAGYLYHKDELEAMYGEERKEPTVYI